jgi:ribose transport system permease protein
MRAIKGPGAIFLVAAIVFGAWTRGKFLEPANLANILVQSSSLAIVAAGEMFVLLTAGVDLSVGATMFIAAAVAGKLVLGGVPLALALPAIVLAGLAAGAANALVVVRLRIPAFLVTLATFYFGRGLALWITETRAMNLPDTFRDIWTAAPAGVPLPAIIAAGAIAAAYAVLEWTPFGRWIYAVGQDAGAARKAGVPVDRVLFSVYVIAGGAAALGSILSLAQLSAVSPTFGQGREFNAIAAAVIGGTSLFGGRGKVFPGTVFGAVLLQAVENGLNEVNADPYLYPIIIAAIIFAAVWMDGARAAAAARRARRRIVPEESEEGAA